MSITLEFVPWAPFKAIKNAGAIESWLHRVAEASENAFRSGMGSYPPASAPGAWPNSRTGDLRGSISSEVRPNSMTVGSNMRYSIFLRMGTSRMARRKMSDNALQEGMAKAGGELTRWVEWSRG